MSTAPATPENHATHPDQTAMQDEDMVQRLEENPGDPDAKLDIGLDQSMDASDPPAIAASIPLTEAAPSSGYDEALETANLGNE